MTLLADLDQRMWATFLAHAQQAALDIVETSDDRPSWADRSVDAENFDPIAYLESFAGRLETTAQRRAYTRNDPVLFALTYLPNHLRSAVDGSITFADAHLDWARQALTWLDPPMEPGLDRHAYIAPRETGKSTWSFLLLPMWAAAHGHLRFIAAFAHSGTQAEMHLNTFRRELARNRLLREDYPALCRPARKPNGRTTADNIQMLVADNGFFFTARGIDSANLGMKVDELRPDCLLFDDIEPDEAKYSQELARKRLGTVIDAVLAMNLRARVLVVGTVTMPGSIIHQLVRAAAGEEPEAWIREQHFTAHHHKPILVRDDGTERSLWPAKWPLDYLNSIRHTRSYLKNFANDPMGADGGYWTVDDFRYGDLEGVTGQILSIDPAVTTKSTSDFTGIAVVGYAPARLEHDDRGRPVRVPSRCVVEEAWEVRLTGDPLRTHVLKLLARYPRVRLVLVERNQAGENWYAILHDLPVKMALVHPTAKKEIRAADVLNFYQRGRVVHARPLVRLEEQMVSFPRAPHDDMVDAVGQAVSRLLTAPTKAGRTETLYQR